MKGVNLDNINIDRATKPLGKPSFADGAPIHGYDTETSDGDVFAIGRYEDDGTYHDLYDADGIDSLELMEFITSGCARNSINVWFNLNFDAQVMLKALPRDNLDDLRLYNRTEWQDGNGKEWSITYIPRKMLEIRTDKHVYRHFDAQQFTYTSLEGATADWLPGVEGKANEDIDVTQFGDTDYIKANESRIRHYMRRDCDLTRRIFSKIVTLAEDLEIPFGKPYSTGYVAADYVRNRMDYKPGWKSDAVQSLAWDAYRGGRFEIAKRGDVGKVYGADINSAYPAVMSELPDPSTLEMGHFGGNGIMPIEDADLRDADYVFVRATITTDADRPFQPFAVKNHAEGGRIEYPALDGREVTVLLDTYLFALDNDFIVESEVHEAALAWETDGTRYPFDFFKSLYTDRKTLEDDGNERPAKLLKIVMNSLYGKTCQTTTNYKEISEYFADAEDEDLTVEELIDNVVITAPDHRGQQYVESEGAGRLFNPFIAAYITGRTRLKLLSSIVENNLEDATVMLATDCIMCEAEAFEASGLYDEAEAEADTYADALGGWDYDYVGDAFVIGSGVYEVEKTDGELKQAARGFRKLLDNDNPIRAQAAEQPDGISVVNDRPITMGEQLARGKPLSEVGRFRETTRTVTADMDTKRQWDNDNPDFADLLEGAEGSKPKVLRGSDDK